ncbi:MAG: hypothetical protein IJ789_02560 [Bacteroidales bacterium]|nr:hypothetical protein [Bacteroidales bacterium]
MGSTLLVILIIAGVALRSYNKLRKAISENNGTAYASPVVEEEEVSEPQAEPDYFTYESDSVDVDTTSTRPQPLSNLDLADQTEPEGSQFDLRQAVIYQAILTNEYTAETN